MDLCYAKTTLLQITIVDAMLCTASLEVYSRTCQAYRALDRKIDQYVVQILRENQENERSVL